MRCCPFVAIGLSKFLRIFLRGCSLALPFEYFIQRSSNIRKHSVQCDLVRAAGQRRSKFIVRFDSAVE